MVPLIINSVYQLLKRLIPAFAISIALASAVNFGVRFIMPEPKHPVEIHDRQLTELEQKEVREAYDTYLREYKRYQLNYNLLACALGFFLVIVSFFIPVPFLDLSFLGGGLLVFTNHVRSLPFGWQFIVAALLLILLIAVLYHLGRRPRIPMLSQFTFFKIED